MTDEQIAIMRTVEVFYRAAINRGVSRFAVFAALVVFSISIALGSGLFAEALHGGVTWVFCSFGLFFSIGRAVNAMNQLVGDEKPVGRTG